MKNGKGRERERERERKREKERRTIWKTEEDKEQRLLRGEEEEG
jgi:hypothetical protein